MAVINGSGTNTKSAKDQSCSNSAVATPMICSTDTTMSMILYLRKPHPPTSTLFPYTTLFRSSWLARAMTAAHNGAAALVPPTVSRSEEHTSELQSHVNLVCRLLLEKKMPVEHGGHQRQRHQHQKCQGPVLQQQCRRHTDDLQHRYDNVDDSIFKKAPPTDIYTLSLHDALPI